MSNLMDRIVTFCDTYERIILISLGVLIFAVLFALKNKIANALLRLASKIFFKGNDEKRNSFCDSLIKPFSYLILALGSYLAISINISNTSVNRFFKILIILIICWCLVGYLSNNMFIKLHFGGDVSESMNTTAVKFLSNIMKIVIIAFAVVMVISELGYNINGLLTGLGVGGLAISLAAQDAVGNLISGFIIIFDKPFKVGDLIETPTVKGFVEEVTMRSTKIRNLDDSVITVPNSTLTNEAITNISMMDKRRIKLNFGLTYSTPNDVLEKVRNEIKAYIDENESILPEPCRIHFREFADSSLNFEVICYTQTSDMDEYLNISNDLNLAIKRIVEANDTDFAYPTSTVYIQK